jgi:hypothetical protein
MRSTAPATSAAEAMLSNAVLPSPGRIVVPTLPRLRFNVATAAATSVAFAVVTPASTRLGRAAASSLARRCSVATGTSLACAAASSDAPAPPPSALMIASSLPGRHGIHSSALSPVSERRGPT